MRKSRSFSQSKSLKLRVHPNADLGLTSFRPYNYIVYWAYYSPLSAQSPLSRFLYPMASAICWL